MMILTLHHKTGFQASFGQGEHPCSSVCVHEYTYILGSVITLFDTKCLYFLSPERHQLCVRAINSYINTHAADSCYITAAMLYLKQVKE